MRKIFYNGKEYKSYINLLREYGLEYNYKNFLRYIINHSLEEAMDYFLNNYIPKEKIIYKCKEYNTYKAIWKEYRLKCTYNSFKGYIRKHSLEETMDYFLNNYIPKEKIVYKGKEYKTYKELWREYGLKCDRSSFISYIRKYGLEEAMDHYLNNFSPKEKIVYKGKEYNSIHNLYNSFKDKIYMGPKTFSKKLKMHLDDIEGFMDLLLEEE